MDTQSLDLIRRLHQHRAWVNQMLLSAAAGLSEQQLHQTFQIGQGTIWKSLTHLFGGEYVWLETLHGVEAPVAPGDAADGLPGNQQGEGAFESLAELRDRWEELEQRWRNYLDQLEETSLEESVGKISSLTGKRSETSRSDILLHVCTHAHYTTAQVINMLRHAGAEKLPDPMLITLARSEP